NVNARYLWRTCIRELFRSCRLRLWSRNCRVIAISMLILSMVILGGLRLSAVPLQPLDQPTESDRVLGDEPITPVPQPPPIDPRKTKLGERLFGDIRLSRDNSRNCLSCHDVSTNGASTNRQDVGRSGANLPLNTLTVFNAVLSFSLGWEGKIS